MIKNLILAVFFTLTVTEILAQRIFWAERNNDRIMVGNLTPTGITGQTPFITGLNGPIDLSIDQGGGRLFYGDNTGEDILAADLSDGSFIETVITTGGMVYFEDFYYSENADAIYGSMNSEVNGVYMIPANNADGGNETSLPLGGLDNDHFLGIAVDDGNEIVNIIDESQAGILATNFSGTGGGWIVNMSDQMEEMTIDRRTSKIYFTAYAPSTFAYRIYACNSDGSGLTLIASFGTDQITGLQVYSQFNKIYFAQNNQLKSVNLDGTGLTTLLSLGAVGIEDIAIETDYIQPSLTARTPADNATGVATGSNLTMTFDENVKISTTTGGPATDQQIRIFRTTGNVLDQTIARGAGTILIANNVVTITGVTLALNSTDYYILVGNKVFSDMSGNDYPGIASTTLWNFTTQPGVTITAPSGMGCAGSSSSLNNIVITELGASNFAVGSSVTLTLGFSGAGYSFEAGTGSVSFTAARNITSASINVTTTAVTVTYTVTGTTLIDAMTLSGLKFTTTDGANPGVNIVRSGGTGTIGGLVTSTVVGTVSSAPDAPVATVTFPSGTTFCQGAAMGIALANATGTSIKWYDENHVEIAAIAGVNNVTGTQLGIDSSVPATYTRYVTQTPATCESIPIGITITIDPQPTTSAAGGDIAVCATSTPLAANTPVIGSGMWTIFSGAGGSFADPSNPATTFTGTPGLTYVLRWSITNGTCATSSDDVTVKFDQTPTTSVAGANQAICATSASLSGNAPTIGTGLWSVFSGAGGTIAAPSSPTSAFTGVAGTTYVLRWTISNGSCTPSSSNVTIQMDAPPTVSNAGPNQVLCGTSAALAANAPTVGTGSWSIVSGAGGTIANPSILSSGFTGVAGTTYVLRWTISNGTCTPSSSTVTISFDSPPTTAVAGPAQNICATSTTLAANVPTIGTGSWSVVSGAGGTIADPTSPTSTFSGVVGTSYILRWTVANGVCTSSTSDVNIQFFAPPTTSIAGGAQSLCATSAVLAGNTPVVGTGLWSIISGAGGTIATPTSPTSTFTGVAGTSYTLRWSISNGTCAPSTSDVAISFIANPTAANAGSDQLSACVSTALGGNTPMIGTGNWSIVTGANGAVTTPSSPSSAFTGAGGASYVLRWTVTNIGCPPSTDDVTVQFVIPPTISDAGTDQTTCASSLNLAGNTPSSGTGLWTIVSGSGGAIANPSTPTSSFTGTTGVTYVLRWTISLAGCSSSQDDVSVTFNAFPSGTGSVVGLGSLCPQVSGVYTVSGIINATDYHWNVPEGLEVFSQSGATATIKALDDAGLKTITVEGENGCGTGGSATLNVTVLDLPDATLDLTSDAFIDDPIVFNYSSSASIQNQSWAFGDGGTSTEPSPQYTYTAAGEYTIGLEVEDDNGCKNSVSEILIVHPDAELTSFSIKNVVTANGDEKNKYLFIERIERFPESEVVVLDRLGVEVFRKKNYTNDWDLRKGEDFLPAGNYVCVVKHNGKVYSRSVTVIKGK